MAAKIQTSKNGDNERDKMGITRMIPAEIILYVAHLILER